MNKFAVIMPLIIASFLLGYFASSLNTEHVFAILAVTVVGLVIAGYLLLKILRRRPKQNAVIVSEGG